MADSTGAVQTLEQIVADFGNKNVTFMAAGIAYNAFVSLAPLLLLLLFVTSVIGTELERRIVELAQGALPGPIGDTFATVFQEGSGYASASVVGIVVLLWGTLKIFRGLDTAFSEIYETEQENSFLDQLIDGMVALIALVLALVATIGATVLFARFSGLVPYAGLLSPLIVVAGLVLAFTPMFYRFPDTDVEWRHVLPGVVFAAVGWALLQSLFQVYLTFSSGTAGGVFGGVLVVVTWLYFSGLVLLTGAVINAVLGGHSSGKAGGVGRAAAGYETTREDDLPPEQFGNYLLGLRSDLTDRAGANRPTVGDDGVRRYPAPDGDVHVIEQTNRDGDTQQWAVSVRWEAPLDETDDAVPTETADRRRRRGGADDSTHAGD
ncbi:ribonuclease BN [Halorientalis sp. IM1011]|uniref:YihY/virulence factor BrkB family protein n=1 Tax=Halorientalis sp. IM1011 TaxID=1932360 RepID=UPI00097CCC31|nr:YihY/virulence factor BrkB family protein [Halorientalis sp. IM1011]AQL41765.1 ribonuclease BN [Halorientalis sp. IM1011]